MAKMEEPIRASLEDAVMKIIEEVEDEAEITLHIQKTFSMLDAIVPEAYKLIKKQVKKEVEKNCEKK